MQYFDAVLLIDSTSMQVATKLFSLFPGRATGRREHWAGVKLHLGWRLFKSVPEVLARLPFIIRDDC